MKAIVKENKELILEDENLMLQKENNIDRIDFEFPTMINNHSIEKFKKYIEIETEDKSVVDEIFNDTYSLTRALTKYDLITIQIVLIYEEKDIVFKTIHRNLYFRESINADENLQQEEQSLLYKMSEKVNQLENYDDTKVKEDISNLEQNISDIQNDNIEQSKKIEDIENSYVKDSDYATSEKAGIVKAGSGSYGTEISKDGKIFAHIYGTKSYKDSNANIFIGKGTLENIKDTYVEEGLQNSNTIENINTEINSIKENYVKNSDYATSKKARSY